MPLYPEGRARIRTNLEALRRGERVQAVAIGTLTADQLAGINRRRATHSNPPLPPIIAEVLFVGNHVHNSRCLGDGYAIEDVLDQIEGALDETAVFIDVSYMTAIENRTRRADRYGNKVCDRAVFECTTRHPRPELFSVMPKGDVIKPKR